MQYTLLTFLSLSLMCSHLLATPQEEIATLEQLVEMSKKNLENQQLILKSVRNYASARENYLADPDNGKLATALVKRAVALSQLLEKEHLSHLFAPDFLSELSFYNQVGKQYLGRIK